jgi:hypothetical protein
VAGGLTARQLRLLLDEHGSFEAAIEARPDLADQLRAARALSDQATCLAEQLREATGQLRAATEIREPEAIDPGGARVLEVELLAEIADKLNQHGSERRRSRFGRPPEELPLKGVERAEKLLGERRRITKGGVQPPPRLTYEAIARSAGLVTPAGRPNRDRIKQFEELVELGWPLRKSHPDFPARPGFVRLPTPREAALLLRSR